MPRPPHANRDLQAAPDGISRRRFLSASAGLLAAWGGLRGAAGVRRAAAVEPRFLLAWGEPGDKPGQFRANVGIALDKEGNVYTAEFRNQRVQKFSPDGKPLAHFPVQPHAGGLAVDAEGNVFVAHWNSHKIAVYSPAGERLREWGAKGTGDGEFQLPGSVAIGPDGLVYVPDQGNSRVQKFTRAGKFVGKWGSLGSEPGQFGGGQAPGGRFAGPQFVAFDRDGNVYTTDAALDRVQKFTHEGKLLAHWGSESSEPGGFGPPPVDKNGNPIMGGPIGIAVDSQNRVWVSATNHKVQLFENDGTFLCGVGGEGTEPGRFDRPHGIVVDSNDLLYVADTMNGRIQKFAVA